MLTVLLGAVNVIAVPSSRPSEAQLQKQYIAQGIDPMTAHFKAMQAVGAYHGAFKGNSGSVGGGGGGGGGGSSKQSIAALQQKYIAQGLDPMTAHFKAMKTAGEYKKSFGRSSHSAAPARATRRGGGGGNEAALQKQYIAQGMDPMTAHFKAMQTAGAFHHRPSSSSGGSGGGGRSRSSSGGGGKKAQMAALQQKYIAQGMDPMTAHYKAMQTSGAFHRRRSAPTAAPRNNGKAHFVGGQYNGLTRPQIEAKLVKGGMDAMSAHFKAMEILPVKQKILARNGDGSVQKVVSDIASGYSKVKLESMTQLQRITYFKSNKGGSLDPFSASLKASQYRVKRKPMTLQSRATLVTQLAAKYRAEGDDAMTAHFKALDQVAGKAAISGANVQPTPRPQPTFRPTRAPTEEPAFKKALRAARNKLEHKTTKHLKKAKPKKKAKPGPKGPNKKLLLVFAVFTVMLVLTGAAMILTSNSPEEGVPRKAFSNEESLPLQKKQQPRKPKSSKKKKKKPAPSMQSQVIEPGQRHTTVQQSRQMDDLVHSGNVHIPRHNMPEFGSTEVGSFGSTEEMY